MACVSTRAAARSDAAAAPPAPRPRTGALWICRCGDALRPHGDVALAQFPARGGEGSARTGGAYVFRGGARADPGALRSLRRGIAAAAAPSTRLTESSMHFLAASPLGLQVAWRRMG